MRRHLTDASYLFVADAASRALNFVAVAWLARTLAPELYGTVIIGAAVLDYALLLCDWGLKTLGTRETARPPEARRFQPRQIAAARALLSLAVFAAAQILVTALPVEPVLATLIRVYLLGLLPYALLIDWYHQGRGAFAIVTAARTAGSILLVAGVLALVDSPSDAELVPWIYVGSMTATSIAMILAGRRRESLLPRLEDLGSSPAVARGAMALGAAALFGQSFIVLPPIIAGHFAGAAGAGILHAALRIVMIVLIVDRVFGALYLPALSRLWSGDRERALHRLAAAYRVVVALGVGAATLTMIFADEIVVLVYGERFTASGTLLFHLAPFVAATLVNTFLAYGLIAMNEERLYLRAGVRSGLIFLVLVVVATALDGVRGTAIAMIVGESAMCLLLYSAFRRHASIDAALPLIISISIGALLLLLSRTVVPAALWQAPLYLGAFALGVLALRGVRVSDLRTEGA